MKYLLVALLIATQSFSQPYPQDYFRSPLDIPLQLSGNFGELRSNHFHAGFDFRTQQKEGFNIYAAAEGYVSRIKISPYGYGKAIYITHPNGFTTVYGHLQKGAGAIEKYIKDNQYKAQSFDIEMMPGPTELPVKKGELVAISGNTGGSQGPHLHFEIRDTKSEKVINPMYFGFDILLPDNKKPVVTNLMVYPIGENSVVNKSAVPVVVDIAQTSAGLVAGKVQASGKIGFGLSAYDMDSNSMNRNGVFEVNAFFNGSHTFGFKFDTFHFDESRYINALIDYPRFKRTSQRVQKLFMENKYPLGVLHPDANNGIINIAPNMAGSYRVEVSDFNGNKTTVSVPVEHSAEPAITPAGTKITPYLIEPGKDYNFEKDGVGVFFPATSFYDGFYLDFDVTGKMLVLNNTSVPVHSPFTITMPFDSAAPDADKMFIASVNGKKLGFNFSTRKGEQLQAKVKALGNFTVAKDTLAPKISVNKSIPGKSLNAQRTLSVSIRDDLSGIKEYKGYLNGKFILFEFDYKAGRLVHYFSDGIYDDGRNDLKVVVTDNVGNSAIFETHFFKSKTK